MEHDRSTTIPQGAGLREVTSAWSDLATDMADAVEGFWAAMVPTELATTRPLASSRHRSLQRRPVQRCRGCRSDPCQCRCCIGDADLVVQARLGEVRVVPIRVTNERRRTRQITLELSGFTSSGGHEVPIEGSVLTRREFELQACEHEDVIVVVQASAGNDVTSMQEQREQGRVRDVDDCVVGYADLRIQGCDVRPVRIAVALLPRSCDAYEVRCSCGCC